MKKRIILILNLLILSVCVFIFYRNEISEINDISLAQVESFVAAECAEKEKVFRYESLGYKWTKVACEAAFAPRDGAGALVFKDSMWLLGGWNIRDEEHFPKECNNEVWSSADGEDWNLVRENTFIGDTFDVEQDWEGRHTAGYAVLGGKMWIIGGDANQGHYQSDVWNSRDGRNWKCVNLNSSVPWGPRVLQHTVVFEGKIWVIGGQTLPQFAESEERFYNDVWNTKDGINWKLVTEEAPFEARGMIGGSAVFNGKIWIIGGGTYETPDSPERKCYNDVWCSEDGVNWEQVTAAAPWEPRQYHEVAVWDNKLWVMGGYNNELGGNRNDVWFSANGKDWQQIPHTPWKQRHAASVFVYKDALWVVAGNNMESDVWRLSEL